MMDKYKDTARKRAWIFKGPEPQSEYTSTSWICNNKHSIQMSFDEVKRLKSCLICKEKGLEK